MTDTINQSLVQQFSDMVHIEAQQMQTRLRNTNITIDKFVTGKDFFYDRLKDGADYEITSRHMPTNPQDATHSRRMGTIRNFAYPILLDDIDDLQTIIDPQSQYARVVARAMFRRYDRIAIEAATATVKTGRKGETNVTFAADGGLTVAAGATGMTYDKLRTTRKNFVNNEIGNDMPEETHLLVTGNQEEDMLGEVELTSGDYQRKNMFVEQGEVTKALGFNIIKFGADVDDPMLTASGGTRTCLALAERSICVGISKDITIEVDKRPDLHNAIQVMAKFYLGAVRTEGLRVQKVNCTES